MCWLIDWFNFTTTPSPQTLTRNVVGVVVISDHQTHNNVVGYVEVGEEFDSWESFCTFKQVDPVFCNKIFVYCCCVGDVVVVHFVVVKVLLFVIVKVLFVILLLLRWARVFVDFVIVKFFCFLKNVYFVCVFDVVWVVL